MSWKGKVRPVSIIGAILLLAISFLIGVASRSAHATEVRELGPEDDVAAVMEQAGEGALLLFRPGIYYVHDLKPKRGQHLLGLAAKVVFRGSVPLTGFQRRNGYWEASGPHPLPLSHGECSDRGSDRCRFREVLFVGDRRLRRVFSLDDLEDGTWHQDRETGLVRLGFDPGDSPVEISYHTHAIIGSAADVTIENITVERYASPAQHGAIHGDRTQRWRVLKVVVQDNSGTGIRLGRSWLLTDSVIRRNGQLGIGGNAPGTTLLGNVIVHNNLNQFRFEWEGGGIKIVMADNVNIIANFVSQNFGIGIWSDIDVTNGLIAKNKVFQNAHTGILYEISGHGNIIDNLVDDNGYLASQLKDYKFSPYAGQIVLSGASFTVVAGNHAGQLEPYEKGIVVKDDHRKNERKRFHSRQTYESFGNLVYSNTLVSKEREWSLYMTTPFQERRQEIYRDNITINNIFRSFYGKNND